MSFKQYLKETKEIDILVSRIIKYLTDEEGNDTWEETVEQQELGGCQPIANDLERKFKKEGVKSVFGEIDTDEPYYSAEEDEERDTITHHWVTIKGKPYDFAKNTLKDYVEFDDVYDPEIEDYSIYHRIR